MSRRFVFALAVAALLLTTSSVLAVTPPKQVFAHYMGCWPAASGALAWAKQNEAKSLRHDATDEVTRRGGHVRNWDLTPPGVTLTAEESADLEIRRALRIGIDGFAVDAWAGSDNAKRSLDALFKVAEEKNYPFQLTVCIDPTCGGKIVETVKYLLDKHGNSTKLARRDGKPLVFGYQSFRPGLDYMKQKYPTKTDKELEQLRASPEGWALTGEAYEDANRQLGQPIYWHFCLGAFFHRVEKSLIPQNGLAQAASVLAKHHVQAIGAFTPLGAEEAGIGAAVKAAGAEWSVPLGMFQKENVPYELYGGNGLDWMCDNWGRVRAQDAGLLQIITWNDYGENSNIAPAYNTRYTLYDLNGYFIQWWKTGKAPVPDHDKVYLISRKYPPEVKVFPFKQGPYLPGMLEVVTILPKAATIRLPGRGAEYEAPAGFYRKQFPVTPGPVVAEVYRGGKLALRLENPDPISERPFREDNSMDCYSTEYARHWQADFGEAKPFLWSEYGDVDGDGLPNWFEMYWFGKFGDMSTAGNADPKALTPSGKTVMQAYQEQLDPTKKPLDYTELPTKGLLAWYRADQGVIADANGRISAWQDQSGNKLHLTATADADKPHLLAKCWNGLPAVELDGVRNSMLCLLPDAECASMTVIAAFAARADDQVCRIQNGANNRLVSICTASKADHEGGIAVGVSSIDYYKGDVAAATRPSFPPGERPTAFGLGFMVNGKNTNYRNWNFTGKVAEILVYVPALSDADSKKVISILKTRYRF
ncbi:MAG TPA: endo-1,3-alpha-glucanase family glycosylhydrolase [Armatimonadota bacterium]